MKEIQKVLEAYLEARVAGDASLWLSLWDEEGVQLFPGARAGNLDLLRETTPARFQAIPVNSANLDVENITLTGEFAITHGYFQLERVVDGEPVGFDGKFLTVLKQQPDGSWKIFRDCSNSNDH